MGWQSEDKTLDYLEDAHFSKLHPRSPHFSKNTDNLVSRPCKEKKLRLILISRWSKVVYTELSLTLTNTAKFHSGDLWKVPHSGTQQQRSACSFVISPPEPLDYSLSTDPEEASCGSGLNTLWNPHPICWPDDVLEDTDKEQNTPPPPPHPRGWDNMP